jgi:hypothetical protein
MTLNFRSQVDMTSFRYRESDQLGKNMNNKEPTVMRDHATFISRIYQKSLTSKLKRWISKM